MRRLRPPAVPARQRFTVTIKRIDANFYSINGPGGIQRRERRWMPRWVLQALPDEGRAIEAQATIDRDGRWCIGKYGPMS